MQAYIYDGQTGQPVFGNLYGVCGMYLIRNTITNHYYIGSSKDIQQRLNSHLYYLHSGTHIPAFQMAWEANPYLEAIVFTAIDREQAYAFEQDYLNRFHGLIGCCNLSKDARAPWLGMFQEQNPMFGRVHSEETKRLQSELKRGANNPMFGTTMTEEHKQMLQKAKAASGPQVCTEETRRKMSETRKGKFTGDQHHSSRRCSVDGITYGSSGDAARTVGLSPQTVRFRLNSKNFETWYWL